MHPHMERDMNRTDEQRAQQLHYDVMGIALAIRGHVGESGLFQDIDRALSAQDWRALSIIQYAFEMLTTSRQQAILSDMADPETVGEALNAFERVLRSMLPADVQRSA